MRTTSIFIVFLIFSATVFSQNESSKEWLKMYCEIIVKLKSDSAKQVSFYSILLQNRTELKPLLDKEYNDFEKRNLILQPNRTEIEIKKDFLTYIAFNVIDNCPEAKSIVLTSLKNCPKQNKTLEMILSAVDNFFATNKNKSNTFLNENVSEIITKTIFENEKIVNKDYKEGILDSKLRTDLQTFLMYKSTNYLKISLFSAIQSE
jgi:hypothetical protein